MTSKKHTRHKLLLDEGLPRKKSFPKLNNLHTARHINHDLKKGGMKDKDIYILAEETEYIVAVFNTKDFKPFISEAKPSVIAISTGLTNAQIDVKLCKVLKKLNPSERKGHLISITNEGENIKKLSI